MIHDKYQQLKPREKAFVDSLLDDAFPRAKSRGIKLYGDDRCEIVAEALAVWVIASRENRK
jgi:hypothetical protein